jgi:hypothetical protein
MDTDAFMRKALGAAKGNQFQQQALFDLVGSQGMKYAATLGELPNAKANFSEDDIAQGKQIEEEEHTVQKNLLEPVAIGGTKLFLDRNFQKAFFLTAWRSIQAGFGRGTLWNKSASWQDGIWNTEHGYAPGYSPVVAMRDGKPLGPPAPGGTTADKPAPDPMDAKLAQQKDEMALHAQDRQQRILDSQRELMTISDRRASIRGEMPGLSKQISDRTRAAVGEGFLTESQRNDLSGVTGKARDFMVNDLRQKYQDQTDELQLRYNKDQGELREKPLDFSVDSMSKVGLYSASAIAFNPLVNIGVKTNQLLTQIVHNTTPTKPMGDKISNPHSP